MAEGAHRATAAIAVAAALACSLVYLRTSESAARLSSDLGYDDVSYFVDAARRLDAGYRDGIVRFVRGFASNPPHSPLSTALGVAGLALFGYRDTAPYAMNALILVGVVMFLAAFFRNERRWVVALFVAAYLTSHIAYRSITDFRPDLALGFLTASFVLLFLDAAVQGGRPRLTAAGVALGLALLAKPSFIAHTVALAFAAFLGYLGLRRRARTPPPRGREVALSLAPGLALALPYYAVNGRRILEYFWTNTRGADARLWSFQDGALAVLYRVTFDRTYAAFSLVGWHLWLFTGAAILACVILAARRRWMDLAVPAGLVCAAALSAAILAFGRHDNEFFSATFHALLMMAGFVGFSLAVRDLGKRARATAGGAFAALTVAAVVASSGLDSHWYTSPEIARGASWNVALVEALRSDARRRGVSEGALGDLGGFVTAAGPVNGAVLEWTARRSRLPATFGDLHRTDSSRALVEGASRADYVVVPNPSTARILRFLPSSALQRDVLDELRRDPRFERVPAAVGADGDTYLLFANVSALERRAVLTASFGGGRLGPLAGFRDEEGPYPDWKLPRVRWLSAASGMACARGVPRAGRLEVRMSLRPAVAGTLRVASAGASVAAFPLAPSQEFQDVRFTVLAAGPETCLDFAVDASDPSDPTRLVLFRRLAFGDPSVP